MKPKTDENTSDKNHPKAPPPETVERTEQDPAVERGERIHTGKQIARSGKSDGKVAGAD